jgi:hypothetical protein
MGILLKLPGKRETQLGVSNFRLQIVSANSKLRFEESCEVSVSHQFLPAFIIHNPNLIGPAGGV